MSRRATKPSTERAVMRPERLRLAMLSGLLIIGTLGLLTRAAWLQMVSTERLQSEGQARHVREHTIPTMRGNIVDRHGEPLAVSTPVESVWANPRELLQHRDRLPELAVALNIPLQSLETRLSQRAQREFIWLLRRMDPDQAERVRALRIPGVSLDQEYRRFYPTSQAAAQLIGTTNIDDIGQEGLEMSFDHWLSGQPGRKRVIRNRLGQVVEDIGLIAEPRHGQTLHLTIDRRIQHLAFRELSSAVEAARAQSGSVVVMDVTNGEILAMANVPSYNPNAQRRGTEVGLRNRAVTDLFEPGSVIKPFLLAAALEAQLIEPGAMIDASPGRMRVSGHTIVDPSNMGQISIEEALARSSNVAMVQLALQMTPQDLWSMYARLGFGQVTGTGFPGESAGVLRDHERWHRLEQATLAYGYAMSVTPLQLVRAMSAIADQGRLRQPVLILDGGQPRAQSVMDPTIAQTLTEQMQHVISHPRGTGRLARVPGYRVAGKTGTSRKSIAGGYAEEYTASFAGFAPATRPRLAIAVVISEPGIEDVGGGALAAPVFSRVMAGALRLMNIPPDDFDSLLVHSGRQP